MLIMIYGLVSDAETARQQLEAVRGILPEDAYNLLSGQLARVSNAGGGRLGFGLLVSFVLAAWSASRAVDSLITAMNVVQGERSDEGMGGERVLGWGRVWGRAYE